MAPSISNWTSLPRIWTSSQFLKYRVSNTTGTSGWGVTRKGQWFFISWRGIVGVHILRLRSNWLPTWLLGQGHISSSCSGWSPHLWVWIYFHLNKDVLIQAIGLTKFFQLSRWWYVLDYHMGTLLSYLGERGECLMVVERTEELIDLFMGTYKGIYTWGDITVTAI